MKAALGGWHNALHEALRPAEPEQQDMHSKLKAENGDLCIQVASLKADVVLYHEVAQELEEDLKAIADKHEQRQAELVEVRARAATELAEVQANAAESAAAEAQARSVLLQTIQDLQSRALAAQQQLEEDFIAATKAELAAFMAQPAADGCSEQFEIIQPRHGIERMRSGQRVVSVSKLQSPMPPWPPTPVVAPGAHKRSSSPRFASRQERTYSDSKEDSEALVARLRALRAHLTGEHDDAPAAAAVSA